MTKPTSSSLCAALALGILVLCVPSVDAADTARPSLAQACIAWREHIGDLIDQHRVASDIEDDTLFEFIRQFVAAQATCSAARYEEGLHLYDQIRLGRVTTTLR
jgi:hypothetical protein